MRLPRWTVYPALALLAAMLLPALPARDDDPMDRLAPTASKTPAPAPAMRADTEFPRVVVLGIDGMDPEILAEVVEEFPERMPNFRWLIESASGIQTLGTATPPQSPVAWSNFITGLNPGGHGVFDFLHRGMTHREPTSSITRTEGEPAALGLWNDWQLPLPWGSSSGSNRSGPSFWNLLMDEGVPASLWRMPINYPVEPSKGISLPGMLTPALDSAYGECTLFTTDASRKATLDYKKVVAVSEFDDRIDTALSGPENGYKSKKVNVTVPLVVYIDRKANAVALELNSTTVLLEVGEWSSFVPVSFDQLPMGVESMSGICRFYLRSIEPEFELYASPVNLDPYAPMSPVAEPSEASAELADAIGLYYTQGMAEDVNSLKNGVLTDEEFMQQVDLVYGERRDMLEYALDKYVAEDTGGFLFFYFSTVDLACHMMWRHSDPAHPHHDAAFAAKDSSHWSGREGSTWKEVVKDLYLRMDPALGRIRAKLGDDAAIIVMSDHGFSTYDRKFSLNTWLYENGYLVLNEGKDRELPEESPEHTDVSIIFPGTVDWSKTRAYGMGFNGLYLNLAGRERDDPETDEDESGIVQAGAEADALLAELKAKLEAVIDPKNGKQVVLRADLATEIYTGVRVPEAPDILVGYNEGYCNSDEASQGQITSGILLDNLGGTFNGSHLMAPDVVNGILLSNQPVQDGFHKLEDLTVEVLARFGVDPTADMKGHRVLR